MIEYADTSFLFSLYVRDANSARAVACYPDLAMPLPMTALHRVELQNAISLAVFQGRIAPETARSVWGDVEHDLTQGQLVLRELNWGDVLKRAESLARDHSPVLGTRSIDILHVASASALNAERFVTFDNRQGGLVSLLKLNLLIPP